MKKIFFLLAATIYFTSCTESDKKKTENTINKGADKISDMADTAVKKLDQFGDTASVRLKKAGDNIEKKLKDTRDVIVDKKEATPKNKN